MNDCFAMAINDNSKVGFPVLCRPKCLPTDIRHIDLSVGRPPSRDWKRRPDRPRAVRRDSNISPVELWRHEVRAVTVLERRCDATALAGRPRDVDE